MWACWLLLGAAGAAHAEQRLAIVVSLLPQKYFAERVGGDRVQVAVMVGPGQSPATYEPTPRQMAGLASARLYWRMGSPFEEVWMPRVVAVNPRLRVVDAREGITLRRMDSAHAVATGEGGDWSGTTDAAHRHAGREDPHIWLDPRLVRHMAARFRDALIELDADHRTAYEANYAEFSSELDTLDRDIRNMLTNLDARRFMAFHPAWGYFADAYDLQQIPIEAEGKKPGAKTLGQLIDWARREGVRVIFVQQQFSRRDAETVAQEIDGQVIAVDPLAEDYADNLRRVAAVFAEAMR